MAEIVMPRLSDTMEEGTILRWLKADGEEVARGEELVEIETDKATMVYESDQAGVLEIVAAEGATLPVGEPIARVGGDAPPALAKEPAEAAAPANGAAGVPGREAPRQAASAPGAAAGPARTAGAGAGERVKASPLARRIAGERGIDLRTISGSGPGGRIVRVDVERGAGVAGAPGDVPAAPGGIPAAPGGVPAAPAAAGSAEPQRATVEGVRTAKGETTEVELSRTQQTVARRMAESKATIPDFTLQVDVDMQACVALRAELKRLAQPDHGASASEAAAEAARAAPRAPTYNDMVVKACALALREHPYANGSYRDGRVQLHSRVNVGVAVAAENALVVPTVFDADAKALGEIARETQLLAERVRTGEITPPELGGGTFTVSNLGMYGVRSFTAIINPPQAAIMSIGAVEPRAVARDGAVAVAHEMTLRLVCDHRILYGAEAARFLARVRELLQAPSALTL
ncbi:MAG TPA: dihydrolipoamide acetyltransferase family protein [Solirubrobacteraceae bacterium]|nr:dihydrolipoamide acetyltransferase family protein [Solirubrobacteraceae bacterium]